LRARARFENTGKVNRIVKNSGVINRRIYLIVIENRIAGWFHVGKWVY